jgi:peptidoglycan hydrolase CwlO-like protein
MESTERDILIEVKTKVELLTDKVNSIQSKMDSNSAEYDRLSNDISCLKPQVEENNKFRWMFITGSISGYLSLIGSSLLFLIKR